MRTVVGLFLLVFRTAALFGAVAGPVSSKLVDADVVIIGATPSGIAAAVSAARSGASVLLFEETAHIGGIVSSGLTNSDIGDKRAVKGLFEEYRLGILNFYKETYGPDSPQVKECKEGHQYEPKISERIFNRLVSGEKNIRLMLRHRLRAAHRDGVKLTRLVVEDLADGRAASEVTGRVFIDATYEGDLAALAGAAYRVGRESRGEFGERQAGLIYTHFGVDEWLDGTTGEGDRGVEAFCFRFQVTRDPANRLPIEKPGDYRREDYEPLLADFKTGKVESLRNIMQLWAEPNGKFEVNSAHPEPKTGVPSESFDLAEENWDWPDAGPERRAEIFQRYWDYTEGLFWFLQNDPNVPERIRNEAAPYGLAADEFTDHRGRPWQIYVREGRRIMGEYTFTEHDADADRPRARGDSIAVVEFAFDSHGVHKFDPAHPGVREGYYFISHPPLPLPYGVIVPQQVDRLLVPVAVSASRVGYQAIRMEPVFMATGEAAGIAAKLALDAGVEVRAVAMPALRAELLKRGAVLELAPLPAEKLR